MATVGKVYAKAVFEMAGERNQLDTVIGDLRGFSENLKSSEALTAVLAGNGIDPRARKAILDDVVKATNVGGMAKSLLELLATKARLSALPEILKELERMVEESRGITAGEVRSAVELSQDEVSRLEAAVAKRVGKKVRLIPSVDPSLLGGVVATVAGQTFDASLRSQLNRFKNELI
jgi:F-type H+-transporting ATPase subunit delta